MALAVGVPGAAGRMGRMIIQVVGETPGVQLAAALERPDSASLGLEAAPGVTIESDLDAALERSQVLIDFTAPAATAKTVTRAAERRVPMVIGTTGCGPAELQAIWKAAEKIPVVMSANMSLGVNVLFGLCEQAARALGDAYDVEIVELHHRLKKDAPSGTALAMAKVLAETLGRDLSQEARYGRQGQVGARTPKEIGILALRGGDIVGEHTAYFCGLGERIEIKHQASSRETFARGALRAAQWLRQPARAAGLYDMQDVLGLRK